MQCKCGAPTTYKEAVRKKQAASLQYQECTGCGRVHIESLKLRGAIIAYGAEAQDLFNRIDSNG